MPPDMGRSLLVTGAAGRIGRALRAVFAENGVGGLPVLWHGRRAAHGIDLVWDIGADPPTVLPKGVVVLHLAGQTRGTAAILADNARATEALCRAANAAEAAHVFLMSSAAVYRPQARPLTEDQAPDPVSDYGRAKLAAEQVAEATLRGPGLTVLRLANLAGADALLGGVREGLAVLLDPIEGQSGGPERSYIGPRVMARVVEGLVQRVMAGLPVPRVVNLAQPGVVAMADLLQAAGAVWSFGPPRAGAVARVVLDVALLQSLFSLPEATSQGLVADMRSIPGWPR